MKHLINIAWCIFAVLILVTVPYGILSAPTWFSYPILVCFFAAFFVFGYVAYDSVMRQKKVFNQYHDKKETNL